MKKILLILTLFSALESLGQSLDETTFYLNTDSIDINTCYINPISIENIHIDKKTRAVYLKTKGQINFFSLEEILKKYTSLTESNSVVFTVDGKVISDKETVRIDKSYFIYVQTKPLKTVNYLDKCINAITLVEITLSTKKIEPKIVIRGSEFVEK